MSSGHFLHPVRGRPSPGHADPADDSHHEQDLGAGGAGHAHGHFPLLLHRPRQRSVRGRGGRPFACRPSTQPPHESGTSPEKRKAQGYFNRSHRVALKKNNKGRHSRERNWNQIKQTCGQNNQAYCVDLGSRFKQTDCRKAFFETRGGNSNKDRVRLRNNR